MKAVIVHKNGDPTDPTVLSVEDNVDIPEPAKGQVLVKVRAAAINPIDWKLARGDFPGLKSGTIGFDVSGVIEKIGPDTETSLKVGDEVYGDAAPICGSFAEYAKVNAVALSPKPKNLDFNQAASLPLAGLTAIQSLRAYGEFKEGQTVCITGGSGGVGSLAVQMAKAMGASHIYATGSSVGLIRSLGADTVINYKEESVADALKGKELDLVIDTIGGLEYWEAAQGALKTGGKFVTLVGDGGGMVTTIANMFWRKLKSFFGSPSYSVCITNTKAPDVIADMKTITEFVEAGKVKPVMDDKAYELTTKSIHDLIRASMSHRAKGKLVLTVS